MDRGAWWATVHEVTKSDTTERQNTNKRTEESVDIWVLLLLPGLRCPHAPVAAPDLFPSTWHGDPGEGLRLAQRVHLDVPERLAHRAL